MIPRPAHSFAPCFLAAAVALVFCAPVTAGAEEPAKKPATEATAKKPEPAQNASETKPVAAANEEFVPPPGFRKKKRGATVVYCRKEKPLGTRFPEEKCYDEAGLKELALRPPWSDTVRACGTSGCTTP